MGQYLAILISILAGVILGVLSNWFYDLLKARELLPEKPSIKHLLVILLSFTPFLLLVALPELLGDSSIETVTNTCPITPQQEFGEAWEAHKIKLGCPLAEARLVEIAEQPFERGHMFWHSERQKIYVTYDQDGLWELFEDRWPSQPTPIPQVEIPGSNLSAPINEFGNVWYEELGGTNSRIGFATYREQLFQDWSWEFDNGFMLKDSTQTIYVFFDDSTLAMYKKSDQSIQSTPTGTVPPPIVMETPTGIATAPLCPYQGDSDRDIIINLIYAEAEAARTEDLEIISTIFASDAKILDYRTTPAQTWTRPYGRYQQLFEEFNYLNPRHFDIQLVGPGIALGTTAYAASGSSGSYVNAEGETAFYNNPFPCDHWILQKQSGCWAITQFEFSACDVPFPPTPSQN